MLAPSQLARPSPLLADNIDPNSHDYVSLTETVHPIDAQVILALKLDRGSGAAVENDGIRLRDIRKMTDDAQTQIKSRVREALGRLISAGDVRLVGVSFENWDESSQAGGPFVRFVNLRARDDRIREVPVRMPGTEVA